MRSNCATSTKRDQHVKEIVDADKVVKTSKGPFLAHPDLAVIFLVRDWGEVSSDPDERALSK